MKIYSLLLLVFCLTWTGCTHKPSQQVSSPTLKPKKENVADRTPTDSLDFILSEKGFKETYGEHKQYYPLSESEMRRAKAILSEFVKQGGGDSSRVCLERGTSHGIVEIEKPLPLRKYFKQYCAYKKRENIIVHINLAAFVSTEEGESIGDVLKNYDYHVEDGGKYFEETDVDLRRGIVIRFTLNGEA